jgi:hypothetical protein
MPTNVRCRETFAAINKVVAESRLRGAQSRARLKNKVSQTDIASEGAAA